MHTALDAYVVDAVRTPRGKAKKSGALHAQKPVQLLQPLYHALEQRNGLDPAQVDDVVLGCVTQIGDQGTDIAKISALYAGWPDSVPGITVNRFCTSGLDAIHSAATKVHAGLEGLVVAGGVESPSRVPMFGDKGAWFSDPQVAKVTKFVHMGFSGDLLANLEGFTREELDTYACRSQQRAAQAQERGAYTRSLVPLFDEAGETILDHDELIRPQTTMERLASLPTMFTDEELKPMLRMARQRYPQLTRFEQRHHVGNAPALADGASLVMLANRHTLDAHGWKPRARIVSYAQSSAEPILMLTAGQSAAQRAIKLAGLTPIDIDLFEFNEAFAGTVLKFQRDLAIPDDKLNVHGGTIALGHALGATGGMLLMTLLDALEDRKLRYGLVAISGGAGVGAATLLERLD